MGVVYKITNKVNGKLYVGKTGRDHRVRWSQHKDCARNPQKANRGESYLYNAMRKHGVENFSIEIVDFAETEEETCAKEVEWIAKLDTTNPAKGYNLTYGGESGKPTPESLARRKGKPCPPEVRAKISASQPNRGKPLSEERRLHLSKLLKGRSVSPERAAAMKAKPPGLGTKRTPEQIERMKAGMRAAWTPELRQRVSILQNESRAKKPRSGHPMSEDNKRKLIEASRARWANMTPEERAQESEKQRAKITGRKCSPEEVAKRAESCRKAWTPGKRAAWSKRLSQEGAIERIRGKMKSERAA